MRNHPCEMTHADSSMPRRCIWYAVGGGGGGGGAGGYTYMAVRGCLGGDAAARLWEGAEMETVATGALYIYLGRYLALGMVMWKCAWFGVFGVAEPRRVQIRNSAGGEVEPEREVELTPKCMASSARDPVEGASVAYYRTTRTTRSDGWMMVVIDGRFCWTYVCPDPRPQCVAVVSLPLCIVSPLRALDRSNLSREKTFVSSSSSSSSPSGRAVSFNNHLSLPLSPSLSLSLPLSPSLSLSLPLSHFLSSLSLPPPLHTTAISLDAIESPIPWCAHRTQNLQSPPQFAPARPVQPLFNQFVP